jgi:hypothetical protein
VTPKKDTLAMGGIENRRDNKNVAFKNPMLPSGNGGLT